VYVFVCGVGGGRGGEEETSIRDSGGKHGKMQGRSGFLVAIVVPKVNDSYFRQHAMRSRHASYHYFSV
jgi:hypothetical protein